jgi:hypothetical protein
MLREYLLHNPIVSITVYSWRERREICEGICAVGVVLVAKSVMFEICEIQFQLGYS